MSFLVFWRSIRPGNRFIGKVENLMRILDIYKRLANHNIARHKKSVRDTRVRFDDKRRKIFG